KKDREERFQSVAELAVALEPFGLPGAASAVDRICRLLGLSRSAATAGARAGEEEGEGLTARMRVKSHMATSPPASARGEWAARQSGEHPAPLSSPGTALAATGPLPTAVLPAAGPRPVPHVLQDEPTAPLPPGGLVLARGAVPAVVALAPAPPQPGLGPAALASQPGLGPAALASQPGLALAALASQPGLGAGTAPPWGHTKPPGEQRARWASIAVGAAALFGLVAGGVALLVTGQRGGQSAGEPAATTGPASSQPSAAPEVARDKDPLPEEPDEPAAPPPTSETRAEPPQQPTAPTSGTSDESAKRRALEAKVWSGRASDDEIRRLRSICMRQGDVACRDRATAMLKQKSAAVADDENPFGGRH
ncbi:MAG: hypothetical protein HY744_00550, partial [Deltaproteobacteria bacterium]|nr:hypothetical protein [Deltaproteobacteria bacterium]